MRSSPKKLTGKFAFQSAPKGKHRDFSPTQKRHPHARPQPSRVHVSNQAHDTVVGRALLETQKLHRTNQQLVPCPES